MRNQIIALVLVLAGATGASAQTTLKTPAAPILGAEQTTPPSFRLGTVLHVEWDYTAADITEGAVSRFEVRVDTGAWVNTALTIPSATGTYKYLLPASSLTLGTHAVSVRACNTAECGNAASTSLTITPLLPRAPGNPRIVPATTPVSLEVAVEMAHAYSTLVQLRRLNDQEMATLAGRYTYPLTRGHVIQFMDEQLVAAGK
jgi:hypothetical protein